MAAAWVQAMARVLEAVAGAESAMVVVVSVQVAAAAVAQWEAAMPVVAEQKARAAVLDSVTAPCSPPWWQHEVRLRYRHRAW